MYCQYGCCSNVTSLARPGAPLPGMSGHCVFSQSVIMSEPDHDGDYDPWELDVNGRYQLKRTEWAWPALARSLWSRSDLTEFYEQAEISRRQWEWENIGWCYTILPRPRSLQEEIKDVVIEMFSLGSAALMYSSKLAISALLFAPEWEPYIAYIPIIQCYFIFFLLSTYLRLTEEAGITDWSYFFGNLNDEDDE